MVRKMSRIIGPNDILRPLSEVRVRRRLHHLLVCLARMGGPPIYIMRCGTIVGVLLSLRQYDELLEKRDDGLAETFGGTD
jgi:hypothetical protein